MSEQVSCSDRNFTESLNFQDLDLPEDLLRGIYTHGFEKPSEIQSRAIRPVILGRDTVAQAQSGTGKTATFVIGSLARIDPKLEKCQALILAPTRELAIQITRVAENIGTFLQVRVHACIGGTSMREDMEKLKQGQHMVVGCPGRVYDMILREKLEIDKIRIFVLDEADEMLSRGFKEQIYNIFKHLPTDVQVCLFSATMPKDTMDLTHKFMRDAVTILVKKTELTLEGIRQYYISLETEEDKFETLCELYERLSVQQSIIYCNTKKKVEAVGERMVAKDFTVSLMHAELKPDQREQVMLDFRSGTSRVMISTDLLARGIDVQQISVVINYDMPKDIENYLHRIGRSGRYGRKGVAINFVTGNEFDVMQHKRIEDFYATTIEELPEDISLL